MSQNAAPSGGHSFVMLGLFLFVMFMLRGCGHQ
jgi:hypothetical protein